MLTKALLCTLALIGQGGLSNDAPGPSTALYGPGLPGSNGVPHVELYEPPALGSVTTLAVEHTRPGPLGAPAVLLIGCRPNGNMLLAVQDPIVRVPAWVRTPLGLEMPICVPSDPILDQQSVYVQVAQVDAGATLGFSLTQGLKITFGWAP